MEIDLSMIVSAGPKVILTTKKGGGRFLFH